ncbi:MAG: hypoxanthine phosphoribosyltransferase [Desulfobacterales bacterium]|jgi:hypoxanthine phosphoribosyltransferase|nr:hypoxanthine phosphoribosyltransferase [Desulfobacterales bacterium]
MLTNLTPVLTKEKIAHIVAELARDISNDYQGRQLVLIGVLKGAFIFLSDLVRHLTIPVEIDFVRASSYAEQSCSSGQVMLTKPVEIDIEGKNVLIVEDIIDTGLTIVSLIEYLKALKPAGIKVCVFIDKHERRKVLFDADYVGYSTDRGFLVGYGLDYAEKYRHLPGIFEVEPTASEDMP